jgi:pimeloyl-ACP methyl ester carboxylesterase
METSYAAYWGLDLHLRDIHAAINEIRRRLPQAAVFLGGHSLGAILAALYAGYDFDRIPGPWPVQEIKGAPVASAGAGFRDLRGLVMLDGAPLSIVPRLTEDQYLHGFWLPGLPRIPGVDQLTAADPRHRVGPFTDTSSLARVEDSILFDVIVVYAYLRPDEASTLPFPPRGALRITNEALLGGILSDQMQPDLFIRASVGSPLGEFTRIPDPAGIRREGLLDLQSGTPVPGESLIRWIPYDRSTPRGRVDLRALEEAILRPRGDFTQWYMPWRLVLDLGLAANLDTADVFARQYVSLTQMRHITLPVLIIGAGEGLIRHPDESRFFLDRIATSPQSERVLVLPGYTHLDIEDAVNNDAVPLILSWIGTVVH